MSLTSLALTRIKVGAGILALLAAWGWHARAVHRADAAGYARAQQQAASAVAKVDAENAEKAATERQRTRQTDIHWQGVTRDLQARIDTLSARNIDLGRLQVRARSGCAAAAGSTAAATEPDGGAGQGGHAVQAGEDPASGLGLQLVRYGAEAELYRKQVIELLEWIANRPKTCG